MQVLQEVAFEGDGAVSALHRGKQWLTAATTITINGKKSSATKRLLAAEESVRLRRRALQQSYYLAALPHLETAPAWGALAGALWDVSSGVDGFNTLVLMILCAVSSLLISHLMRNNLITALVLGAGSITAYEIIYIAVRFW